MKPFSFRKDAEGSIKQFTENEFTHGHCERLKGAKQSRRWMHR
jgi:hypothetical protein